MVWTLPHGAAKGRTEVSGAPSNLVPHTASPGELVEAWVATVVGATMGWHSPHCPVEGRAPRHPSSSYWDG